MNASLLRPVVAELLGTTLFVFVGAGSVVVAAGNPAAGNLAVALAHGVAIAVVVSATFAISGAHVNPAVTLGLFAIRKVDGRTALAYIGAQLAGAVLAAALLKWLFPPTAARLTNLGTPALAAPVSLLQGTLIEAVLTFLLMSAVLGTLVARDAPRIGGLGVGLAVLAGSLVAGNLTGGMFNPARAFGPALVSFEFHAQAVYWIGPCLGAVLAAVVWKLVLFAPDESGSRG